MIIKIDVRERELIDLVNKQIANYPNIQVEVTTLPIGDIIICLDNSYELVIIERKSVADLAASIKDGRYEEQSYRLNGLNHHNHNIIYLIEGDINKFGSFNDRMIKSTLYSAMFSINYYKGFSLMRSFSLVETATIICNMASKLAKEHDKGKIGYYLNINNINNDTISNDTISNNTNASENTEVLDKAYVSVVKKVKKDNITPENIGEIMLCQIPSISSTTALAVLQKFKTISELIKQIELCGEECLNDILTTDANGKSRKISKACVANIIKFLLPSKKT
jgi:ERCC4-type nuclease